MCAEGARRKLNLSGKRTENAYSILLLCIGAVLFGTALFVCIFGLGSIAIRRIKLRKQSSLVIFLLGRSDIVAVATVILKPLGFSGILFAIN